MEATLQPSLIQPFCELGWPLQPVTDHNIIRVFNGGFVGNEHEPTVTGEIPLTSTAATWPWPACEPAYQQASDEGEVDRLCHVHRDLTSTAASGAHGLLVDRLSGMGATPTVPAGLPSAQFIALARAIESAVV